MKRIPVDIYNTSVRVLVGENCKKHPIFKKYGFRNPPTFFDGCDGATIEDSNDEYGPLIWLRDKKNIPNICHEVLHAAFHILGSAGVKVDDRNHEALTYLVGFLMKEILK